MQLNRILALTLVFLCLIAAILAGSNVPEVKVSAPSRSNMIEQLGATERIAVLNLQGPITASTGSIFAEGVGIQARLQEAAESRSVKAVLLKINSPGGTVGASQEIYRAIQAIREAGKPVIATLRDVAASGGYYVASAADKIYANPGTLTGSIGVILQGLNVSELFNEVGIQAETYKTGQFKDILSLYRSSTEAEKALLQELIDTTLEQFIIDVSQGRQALPQSPDNEASILTPEMIELREAMTVDQVRQYADGRIMTGTQAVAIGLVDAIGGAEEAIADLRILAGDVEEDLVVGTGFNDIFRQFGLQAPQLFNWTALISSQISRFSEHPLDQSSTFPSMQPPLQWLAPTLVMQ